MSTPKPRLNVRQFAEQRALAAILNLIPYQNLSQIEREILREIMLGKCIVAPCWQIPQTPVDPKGSDPISGGRFIGA